jgi:hypothetical protein
MLCMTNTKENFLTCLLFHNNILTADNLQKRVWQGTHSVSFTRSPRNPFRSRQKIAAKLSTAEQEIKEWLPATSAYIQSIAPLVTDFLMRLPRKSKRVTDNISTEQWSILRGISGRNTSMCSPTDHLTPPGCSGFLAAPSLFYPLVICYVVSP